MFVEYQVIGLLYVSLHRGRGSRKDFTNYSGLGSVPGKVYVRVP